MKLMRIGIDLAKQVFQLHGVDQDERTILRKRLSREQLAVFLDKEVERNCEIAMEACGGAHYWGRRFQAMGFTVKLIAPQFVKPYVKRQKNDANDAEAICEAMSRPSMRFVPVKMVAQEDIQAVHRIRSELVHQRTAKVNQIRGLLAERGLVVAQRIEQLRRALPQLYEDDTNGLSCRFRRLLGGLWQDLLGLDTRIQELDREIALVAGSDDAVRRLQGIPGIGPVTATALVAAVGEGRQFKRGRDLAAWLGLTPRQHSSGGKERLLGICKRGDSYLRTLLIQGARAVLRQIGDKADYRSQWLRQLQGRRHANVAAVALANKNARIAWALLAHGETYQGA